MGTDHTSTNTNLHPLMKFYTPYQLAAVMHLKVVHQLPLNEKKWKKKAADLLSLLSPNGRVCSSFIWGFRFVLVNL
uniref:Uncharacterized protein n=1 Tax=Fundulus heteroclitus TaxID=8078 RepID=A0A146PTN6_FUNHE